MPPTNTQRQANAQTKSKLPKSMLCSTEEDSRAIDLPRTSRKTTGLSIGTNKKHANPKFVYLIAFKNDPAAYTKERTRCKEQHDKALDQIFEQSPELKKIHDNPALAIAVFGSGTATDKNRAGSLTKIAINANTGKPIVFVLVNPESYKCSFPDLISTLDFELRRAGAIIDPQRYSANPVQLLEGNISGLQKIKAAWSKDSSFKQQLPAMEQAIKNKEKALEIIKRENQQSAPSYTT